MRGTIHILAVDDDVIACQLLQEVLQKEGYQVSTATSGQAAIRLAQDVPFDLAILLGYTQVSGDVNMESAAFPRPAGSTAPQRMPFELNAWLVQALISKKLSMITFYGGVGYNAVKSTADIKGSYVVYSGPNGSNVTLTDPVNLDFKNNSFRLNGGFRLNLAAFFISGEYVWQEYSTASFGLGFTVR